MDKKSGVLREKEEEREKEAGRAADWWNGTDLGCGRKKRPGLGDWGMKSEACRAGSEERGARGVWG
jgi:hypothetical protein